MRLSSLLAAGTLLATSLVSSGATKADIVDLVTPGGGVVGQVKTDNDVPPPPQLPPETSVFLNGTTTPTTLVTGQLGAQNGPITARISVAGGQVTAGSGFSTINALPGTTFQSATLSLVGNYFNDVLFNVLTSPARAGAGSLSFTGVLSTGTTVQTATPIANTAGTQQTFSFLNTGLFSSIQVSASGVGIQEIRQIQFSGVTAVPGPIAGAGLPALFALGGLVWARRRKTPIVA